MDWIMGSVIVGVGIAVGSYVYYKYIIRSGEAASRLMTIVRAGHDAIRALKKFDKWADERYGPGEIPGHLKNVRDEIKSTIDSLSGEVIFVSSGDDE